MDWFPGCHNNFATHCNSCTTLLLTVKSCHLASIISGSCHPCSGTQLYNNFFSNQPWHREDATTKIFRHSYLLNNAFLITLLSGVIFSLLLESASVFPSLCRVCTPACLPFKAVWFLPGCLFFQVSFSSIVVVAFLLHLGSTVAFSKLPRAIVAPEVLANVINPVSWGRLSIVNTLSSNQL